VASGQWSQAIDPVLFVVKPAGQAVQLPIPGDGAIVFLRHGKQLLDPAGA